MFKSGKITQWCEALVILQRDRGIWPDHLTLKNSGIDAMGKSIIFQLYTTMSMIFLTFFSVSTSGTPLTRHPEGGSSSHTGAVVGIIVAIVIIALVTGVYCYKRKKHSHKSKYIVFSNPKYHKDNLPGNDISMDSPLTSSSLSILA